MRIAERAIGSESRQRCRIEGGTVTLGSGRTLYYHTSPRKLFLEPDHKYLLVLSYHSEGDFYQYVDDWDISTGTVRANTDRTQYLAREGRSSLDGLTVQQLGPAVGKLLYGAIDAPARKRVLSDKVP